MKRLKLLFGTELPLLLILAFALLPWLWMVLSSFRPDQDLTTVPIALWPNWVQAQTAPVLRVLQNPAPGDGLI